MESIPDTTARLQNWLRNTYVGRNAGLNMWAVYSSVHYGRLGPYRHTEAEANRDRDTMTGSYTEAESVIARAESLDYSDAQLARGTARLVADVEGGAS